MAAIRNPFARKKVQLDREQSLDAVPIRNQLVEVEVDEELGETLILIPRRETRWVGLLSRFFYIPTHRKVTLDELGSFVWELCDGQNTVQGITRQLAGKYKLSRREAELSLVAFLKDLAKKKLIGLAIPEKAERKSDPVKKARRRNRKKRRKVKATP